MQMQLAWYVGSQCGRPSVDDSLLILITKKQHLSDELRPLPRRDK